ncbi:MAG: hypothetical protein HYY97_02320 [Rhodocyclales bacterium]|nr:hypothetical protein [Rhodocyclales bacterium]
MPDLQNLAYALTQVAHNFGAAAVVGGAVFARWPARQARELRRRLAWLVLAGWLLQGASGGAFGAVSYAYYGRFPDIHGIAVAALLTKMASAGAGLVLAAAYLKLESGWTEARRDGAWAGLAALAAIALAAAAFLRWFS